MRTLLVSIFLLAGIYSTANGQEADSTASGQAILTQPEKELVAPPVQFYVPHWYLTVQGGASYDVGEAKFGDLISPAAQITLGYEYTPWLSTRLAVSGWQARNKYAYPEAKYKWNFIQPSIDVLFNLVTLIDGWKPQRPVDVYAFAGLGTALSFNNDEAVEADGRYGIRFQKLWSDTRWNPVVRAGLGADFRITDNIALSLEANANMLPDHFNSKMGRSNNKDWHFNALAGIKINIGWTHGKTEGVYRDVVPVQPPKQEFVDVPVEKISFNVNIHFLINQSIIRSVEIPKLDRLVEYLREHPRAFIRLSGYADKDTGTPEINMRLSRERAQAVSKYLHDEGIQDWRIRRFAKGDRVQPFDIPEDNRVCICFVYDPDDPKYSNDINSNF